MTAAKVWLCFSVIFNKATRCKAGHSKAKDLGGKAKAKNFGLEARPSLNVTGLFVK